MPNGNPDFNSDACESFFGLWSGEIADFAARRNLRFQKYYHDSPSWDFCFLHPLSGQAVIQIELLNKAEGEVTGSWAFDDMKRFTRSIRRGESHRFDRNTKELTSILTKSFNEIIGWECGDWDSVHEGYERIWTRVSDEMRQDAIARMWPKPIIET